MKEVEKISNMHGLDGLTEKFKNINSRLDEIYHFYNRYSARLVQTLSIGDEYSSEEELLEDSKDNITFSRQHTSGLQISQGIN